MAKALLVVLHKIVMHWICDAQKVQYVYSVNIASFKERTNVGRQNWCLKNACHVSCVFCSLEYPLKYKVSTVIKIVHKN